MAGELDDERAVLGDELQQRGDPQGELIGLQLALEALPPSAPPARRGVIERKIDALLDQHHDALYGALAPHVARLSRPDLRDPALVVKTWRGGFADAIWLQRTRTMELADIIAALRGLPILRFVRRIELGAGDQERAVAALEPLPSLRELVLAFTTDPLLTSVRLADTAQLEQHLAQLEVLRIQYATAVSVMGSPTLRVLELYSNAAFSSPAPLFDYELPLLQELTAFHFRVDASLPGRYPRLRRLALSAQLPPNWLEGALGAKAFERLETLAISRIGDAELQLIADNAQQFAAMKKLDLSGNYFSPEARAAVADRIPRCLRYR